MTPSPQQDAALRQVAAWLKTPGTRQWFYLAGYAGTGKTTLARRFAEDLRKVVYGAFTGKAAQVMRNKGCEGAATLHSLIYTPVEEGGVTTFRLNHDSPVRSADLVIVDEVSMVGEDLALDLLSFQTKVLVLGDPAQLPPVKGAAFFTAGAPDVMLSEVHRQAAENPIIRLSMEVRAGRRLEPGAFGSSKIVRQSEMDPEDARRADQILVGLNRTRHVYNGRMREVLGFEGEQPNVGERLVCLRNNRTKKLFNGSIWEVAAAKGTTVNGYALHLRPLDLGMPDQVVDVDAHVFGFTGKEKEIPRNAKCEVFDFGYALTVHKSQGSQWDVVCLFDQSAAFREDCHRHLYTGITRAAERITIVV